MQQSERRILGSISKGTRIILCGPGFRMVIFCSDVYNLFLGGIFNITVSDVENHH